MRQRIGLFHFAFFLVIVVVAASGCAVVQQMQDALVNVRRLQFKLDSVMPGSLAGVNLAKVSEPTNLSVQDGLKLATAFAQKSLPLSWTLNVAAVNPNDGTGGSPKKTATLTSLSWILKIEETETIAGNIASPIDIPGTGEATIIPLQMTLDLYEFFGDRGYKDVLHLALAIAGQKGSASRLALVATPEVEVGGIKLKYPGQITIVDKEFTNP
ncbi:MAG: hypothetical protein ONA90_09045 [candidate division KSB1 bacterium]|nr:hypothetical protein [candidate division KSB1 bacterium]